MTLPDEFESLNDYVRTIGSGGSPDGLAAEITGEKQPNLETEAGQAALDLLQFARDVKRDHGGDIDLGQVAESVVRAAEAASGPDRAVVRSSRVLAGIQRYAEAGEERYSTWTGEQIYTPDGSPAETTVASRPTGVEDVEGGDRVEDVEGGDRSDAATSTDVAASAAGDGTNGPGELTGPLEGLGGSGIDDRVAVALTEDPETFDGDLVLMQRVVADGIGEVGRAIEDRHGGTVNPNLDELVRNLSPPDKSAFQEKAVGLIDQIREGAERSRNVSMKIDDDRQLGLYRPPADDAGAESADSD